MNIDNHLVGRFAQLQNITLKPELNDTFVVIQSYLPENDRFIVLTIPPPTTRDIVVCISVKVESLKLHPQHSFSDKYPDAIEVQVVDIISALQDVQNATVFTLDIFMPIEQSTFICFSYPYRILGSKMALDCIGLPSSSMKTFGEAVIHVAPDDENSVIEFEDISFIDNPCFVTKGKHTTFRRCSFQNAQVLIGTGNDPMIAANEYLTSDKPDRTTGTPCVVFENCLFDAGSDPELSYGVHASFDSSATFLNCAVRNFPAGILVTDGANASLLHCRVENSEAGLFSKSASSLTMRHCTLLKCENSGIVLTEPKNAMITGCRVEKCRNKGIVANGAIKHLCRLDIQDCHVSGCCEGVSFNMGMLSVRIGNCIIRNNDWYGLTILPGVVGNVDVSHCTFEGNNASNILNAGRTRCTVTVDGVKQNATDIAYEPPDELYARRCCKRAGICDILCQNCGKKEIHGEKFKKCGRCEDVCYCSKECQKAHWNQHKVDCKLQGTAAMHAAVDEARKLLGI